MSTNDNTPQYVGTVGMERTDSQGSMTRKMRGLDPFSSERTDSPTPSEQSQTVVGDDPQPPQLPTRVSRLDESHYVTLANLIADKSLHLVPSRQQDLEQAVEILKQQSAASRNDDEPVALVDLGSALFFLRELADSNDIPKAESTMVKAFYSYFEATIGSNDENLDPEKCFQDIINSYASVTNALYDRILEGQAYVPASEQYVDETAGFPHEAYDARQESEWRGPN